MIYAISFNAKRDKLHSEFLEIISDINIFGDSVDFSYTYYFDECELEFFFVVYFEYCL